jgi:hypothetical protein
VESYWYGLGTFEWFYNSMKEHIDVSRLREQLDLIVVEVNSLIKWSLEPEGSMNPEVNKWMS